MNNGRRGGLLFFGLRVLNQSVAVATLFIAMPLTSHALTLGQIDDFQDGTAQSWQTGAGPVANVANGGPAGTGDHFMQTVSTGGFSSDSRLTVFNTSQWQGDYIDAGITTITMDLNNFSSQPLSMRLTFFVDSSDGYSSTTPFSLAANSGWQHATFSLNAAAFTALGAPGDFNTLLSDFTGQLRLLDSSIPSLRGDSLAATLGADNIQAVPEPSAIVMVGIGTAIGALMLLGRRYKWFR